MKKLEYLEQVKIDLIMAWLLVRNLCLIQTDMHVKDDELLLVSVA